jgi:hypothetical protein
MANADGGTPMMRALKLFNADRPRPGIAEVLRKLVSVGADPNLWYTGGRLPVHVAPGPTAQIAPVFDATTPA